MKVVNVRNVSEAWGLLEDTLRDARPEQTRAGPALVAPCPVTTVYERPTERVLFCPARDANPFFHLMEALWMLAGRSDARFLDRYVADFGKRFAEPDGFIHGAYGYRWRNGMGTIDQLHKVVDKLRANPSDRQAVIQMWDQRFWNDLAGEWKDRPCNTHVYLRVRRGRPTEFVADGPGPIEQRPVSQYVLDLTVLCRSNDAVWGAYGANAVHFSVLQEYLAARIGVGVGVLYQVSNNFHVYEDVWSRVRPTHQQQMEAESVTIGCAPMFDVPERIDEDLTALMDWHENLWGGGAERRPVFHNSWFGDTARRVARAWFSRRAVGSLDAALAMARGIGCPAWRAACMEWLQRRGAE